MLNDMRWHIVMNFQTARDLLKPLYEIARLNSKVTRGSSIALDLFRKQRFAEIEASATLDLYRKPRLTLVSPNTALLKYYHAFKDVKEKPAPRISAPPDELRKAAMQKVPLIPKTILREIKNSLPISDLTAWAIHRFPDYSTDKILGIILIAYSEKSLVANKRGRGSYTTKTHYISGPKLEIEAMNG
jgi:hypothetical protein